MLRYHFQITLAGEFDAPDLVSAQDKINQIVMYAVSPNEEIIYDVDKQVGKFRGIVEREEEREPWK